MSSLSKEERLENARRKLKEYRSSHMQNIIPSTGDVAFKKLPMAGPYMDNCNIGNEADAFASATPSSYVPALTHENVKTDSFSQEVWSPPHSEFSQYNDLNRPASECCSSSSTDGITTFTTEKVAQISQELNHLISSNFVLHGRSGTPSEAATTIYSPDVANCGIGAFRTGSHFSLPNSLQGNNRDSTSASSILIRDLQQRNLELATLLEQRNDKHDRAVATAESLRDQLHRLKLSSEEEKRIVEVSSQRELAKMQRQLRAHSQTVGSLVAEKTELEAKLEHSERAAQARSLEVQSLTASCNDVRAKLRALEDELQLSKSASAHSETAKAEALSQLVQWQLEAKREKDLQKRLGLELKNREEALVRLEIDMKRLALSNEDLGRQLEIATAFTKSGAGSTAKSDPAQLKSTASMPCTRCESLRSRIHELETTEVHTSAEKAHLELQYKAYVSDMEMQVANLRSEMEKSNTKIEGLQRTREELLLQLQAKEGELSETVGELKQLRTDKANRDAVTATAVVVETLNSSIERPPLGEAEVKGSVFYKELEVTADALKYKVNELSDRLSETVEALSVAEARMADRESVLSTAASERSALSRAMEQNAALKDRLMHMQDALDIAKKSNKEIEAEQLELQSRLEAANSPCAECESLRAQLSLPDTMTASTMTTEEENANHSTLALEKKSLIEALSKVPTREKLMEEVNELRDLSRQQAEHIVTLKKACGYTAVLNEKGLVEANSKATEVEQQIDDLPQSRDDEESNVMTNAGVQCRDSGTSAVCQTEYSLIKSEELLVQLRADLLQSKADCAELEQRYAQLSSQLVAGDEEKTRLEGIIAQLEMESSTIDEYVTMFAHRRQMLLRRAKIRDALLLRLIGDRNELRKRLQSLCEVANAVIASSFAHNEAGKQGTSPSMIEFEKALTEFRTNLDTSPLSHRLDLNDEAGDDNDGDGDSEKNDGEVKAVQSRFEEGVLLDEQLRRYVSTADNCLNCEICAGSLLIV